MRILAINCTPDISYFTNKGLKIILETITTTKKFPLKYLYKVKSTDNSMVDLYTPDVGSWLEKNYTGKGYNFIVVGWNPSDYGPEVAHTGGYTHPIDLSDKTFWMTIRNDSNAENYFCHEMMHALRLTINYTLICPLGFIQDCMDSTVVNGHDMPYYKNDYTIQDPDSNFNQMWLNINPYIPLLNKLNTMNTVTITRTPNSTETPGTLLAQVGDTTFTCKTLERPYINNQRNISCIIAGTYTVKWKFHIGKFGWKYEVQNVPNRGGILIHAGNYFTDSQGCILLGQTFADINGDKVIDITNSRVTVDAFEKLMGKQDFTLIIK